MDGRPADCNSVRFQLQNNPFVQLDPNHSFPWTGSGANQTPQLPSGIREEWRLVQPGQRAPAGAKTRTAYSGEFIFYAHYSFWGGENLFPDPQESAMDIARKQNCATPNSIVEQFKTSFETQWARTMKSGEENGSLIFYEGGANTYPEVKLSEGKHLRLGTTQYAPVIIAMPETGPETSKALTDFRNAKRTVNFIAFFHTHPNYPGTPTQSQSGKPSQADMDYQRGYGNPLGIIRTGNGYSFFSNGKSFGPTDAKANECIFDLNRARD